MSNMTGRNILIFTSLTLIVFVFVILLCLSNRRKKQMLLNGVTGSSFVDKCDSNDSTRFHSKKSRTSQKSIGKNKFKRCICCLNIKTISASTSNEPRSVVVDDWENLTNTHTLFKEEKENNMTKPTTVSSDSIDELENARLSHVLRGLPPLPGDRPSSLESSIDNDADMISSLHMRCDVTGTSMALDQSPINSVFGSRRIVNSPCLCQHNPQMPSVDDLSSADYDPTYAAIRRVKASCPVCGSPSIYTPATSNRNSNHSLQLNSCVRSPIRRPIIMIPTESLNNSTYASIAKVTKNVSKTKTRDSKFGCSILQREKSISQGDIESNGKSKRDRKFENVSDSSKLCIFKNNKNPSIANANAETTNVMSLWSLMAPSRNSFSNLFPVIPERAYGQSVVDLVDKLRANTQLGDSTLDQCSTGSNVELCHTQPVVSYKDSPSFHKDDLLTHSCLSISGPSFHRLNVYSQMSDYHSKGAYDYHFPDTLGLVSQNPTGKCASKPCKNSFHPSLTPPLSPMYDCEETESAGSMGHDESKFENKSFFLSQNIDENSSKPMYEDLDGLLPISDNDLEIMNKQTSDSYEYLSDPQQIFQSNFCSSDVDGISSFQDSCKTSVYPSTPIDQPDLLSEPRLRKESLQSNLNFAFEHC